MDLLKKFKAKESELKTLVDSKGTEFKMTLKKDVNQGFSFVGHVDLSALKEALTTVTPTYIVQLAEIIKLNDIRAKFVCAYHGSYFTQGQHQLPKCKLCMADENGAFELARQQGRIPSEVSDEAEDSF